MEFSPSSVDRSAKAPLSFYALNDAVLMEICIAKVISLTFRLTKPSFLPAFVKVFSTALAVLFKVELNFSVQLKKLQGSIITDRKDKETARKMGCAMARLHKALIQCEKEMEFWDNSLLNEMKGWVRERLADHDWKIIDKESYDKTVEMLENAYDNLPKQLIHRDVHFGNFLFCKGDLSGYIDFDLSQRNIRIFDICYFLTGLLAEETDEAFTKDEWIEIVNAVISGYENVMSLSAEEKNAIPCVMESIEILFVAYFIGLNDMEHANGGYSVYRFVHNCESEIKNII